MASLSFGGEDQRLRTTSRGIESMYDYVERRDSNEPPDRQPQPSSAAVIHDVDWHRVGVWLTRGASDIVACRGRSLLFGLCFAGMGHAIVQAHDRDWSWLPGFSAGFLFLGPLLAVGIYELSRQRERGESADLVVAMFAWCRNPRGLCLHAALLGAVLSVWLNVSWTLLNRTASTTDAAAAVLPSALWWLTWTVFSLLAFVSSVVAVPMLLDRSVGVIAAVRTSAACCIANAKTMCVWALAVASTIGASLWLDFWPLLVTGPWIGHATWHAYRDCVGEPAGEAAPA